MAKIKKEKTDGQTVISESQEHYPWGSSLSFENEMVDELGLNECDVDHKVAFSGVAFVESKSSSKVKDQGLSQSIRLQITDIKFKKNDSKDRSDTMYGESE